MYINIIVIFSTTFIIYRIYCAFLKKPSIKRRRSHSIAQVNKYLEIFIEEAMQNHTANNIEYLKILIHPLVNICEIMS
ncbi:unnamed protein product [Rhizophagus irregularis]|nr:unnamed protein product [Rhizophagus irregularis]CAB4412272.1 unnamed protein product [Rhizophagus irregularis]